MPFDARAYLEFFGFRRIKTQGDNEMASCFDPFGLHPKGDKKQSFGIHKHTGLANCYVCGGWNIEQVTALLLTDLSKHNGNNRVYNEYDAWVWLEEKNWIPEYTVDDFLSMTKRLTERREVESYPVDLLKPYYQKLHKSLLEPQGDNERYFTMGMIKQFGLGYCPVSKRVIIPVWDSFKRLRGVISRATRQDDFIRYGVGTFEPELFKLGQKEMFMVFEKGRLLYGENYFEGHDTLLLIESPLDVPWCFMAGLADRMDIGAMFGAHLTLEQETTARSYKRVILGFDDDDAGRQGTIAATKRLMGFTQIYTADFLGKKDPGQMTLKELSTLDKFIEPETFAKFSALKPME